MSKPEYTNLFAITANNASKDVTISFYNDWFNQLDLVNQKQSPERGTEQIASLVMSYHNAKELTQVLTRLVENIEKNSDC